MDHEAAVSYQAVCSRCRKPMPGALRFNFQIKLDPRMENIKRSGGLRHCTVCHTNWGSCRGCKKTFPERKLRSCGENKEIWPPMHRKKAWCFRCADKLRINAVRFLLNGGKKPLRP